MRKVVFLSIFSMILIMVARVPAQAVLFEFFDNSNGVVSATLDITNTASEIIATLNNTSPEYAPGIVGFGFSTIPSGLAISDWTLEAYNSAGELIRIDAGDIDASYFQGAFDGWQLGENYDPNSGLGLLVDWYPNNDAGVQGALYAPSVTSGFGGPPQFFTTAVLTLMLDSAIADNMLLDYSDLYTRWQNVGPDGRQSFKLLGTPSDGTPVPEPATILLIGVGLLGLAGANRKMSKKNKRQYQK